jgi:hypothetical protein
MNRSTGALAAFLSMVVVTSSTAGCAVSTAPEKGGSDESPATGSTTVRFRDANGAEGAVQVRTLARGKLAVAAGAHETIVTQADADRWTVVSTNANFAYLYNPTTHGFLSIQRKGDDFVFTDPVGRQQTINAADLMLALSAAHVGSHLHPEGLWTWVCSIGGAIVGGVVGCAVGGPVGCIVGVVGGGIGGFYLGQWLDKPPPTPGATAVLAAAPQQAQSALANFDNLAQQNIAAQNQNWQVTTVATLQGAIQPGDVANITGQCQALNTKWFAQLQAAFNTQTPPMVIMCQVIVLTDANGNTLQVDVLMTAAPIADGMQDLMGNVPPNAANNNAGGLQWNALNNPIQTQLAPGVVAAP